MVTARRIRIVLIDMPRLLRGLVLEAVGRQADMEVVGEEPGSAEFLRTMPERSPDVVIVGEHGVDADDFRRFLERKPDLKVLAVVGDGREVVLYTLDRSAPLGELSQQRLLHTIRTITRR